MIPIIEIKNLTKIYPHQNEAMTALNDINLSIHRGEIFGIIGKSGSGKSSLIRCINLLEFATKGKIILDGIVLSELNQKQLRLQRRNIGMIFQHFNLLESRTVFENIAFPLELVNTKKNVIKQQVDKLLKLVDLEDRANYYPQQLSGGQKQRVAIARALITHPKILLCDEATSALDPTATKEILALLKKINQQLNITILVITHEMEVVKNICHRVAVLHHGVLVEEGKVLDVFTKPKQGITQELTNSVLHLELPDHIAQNLQKELDENLHPTVRLTFVGQNADQPIVTTLLQRFNVEVNILLAHLESIQNTLVGYMICKLQGEKNDIQQAIEFLEQQKINIKIIGYE